MISFYVTSTCQELHIYFPTYTQDSSGTISISNFQFKKNESLSWSHATE